MKFISLLFLVFSTQLLLSQQSLNALQQTQVDVVFLSADLLEGREAGTKGERMAAEYIASRFAQLGLSPAGQDKSWFYTFDFTFNPNPHGGSGEARKGINVAGWINNKAKNTIVIGAHYDHLGYGSFGSRHTGEPAIHNGADDNASGVAGLLRLAALLKNNRKAKSNNYLFVAFSAEELGLVGSKKMVADQLFFKPGTVNYMLNMDMIGRLNEEKVLAVNGTGTSPTWKDILAGINTHGLNIKTSESGMGPSDHASFYLQDIPVLHFFTGQHMDYHKPEDDAERINYEGIVSITDYMLDLIQGLDKSGKLVFSKTKDEQQGQRATAFKVSLGVMPDYVYDGEGMRIDGVSDGKPAQAAGLKKADVIIGLGDVDVKNIQDYMAALGKLSPGVQTTVKIKRGEDILTLPVKL
jgi:hypothetical protein